MDLSVEPCRLCQIDKTVKIFENVAFSGSHFLKSIYLLQARNISILDIVSTIYGLSTIPLHLFDTIFTVLDLFTAHVQVTLYVHPIFSSHFLQFSLIFMNMQIQ